MTKPQFNILSLLTQLKSKRIAISLDDSYENLRIRGELKNLTREEKQEIADHKIELIAFLKDNLSGVQTVEVTKEQSSYPISDAQRRLWILSQFKDGSVAYNMPQSIYLNKDLDVKYLKQAIYATIDRHEILRTIFRENDQGEVRQWILSKEELGFEIEYQDYREDEFGQKKAESFIAEDSYKEFDLRNGPLLRAALLQIADDQLVFYFNMHHMICDGWSMKVLNKDVFFYYEKFVEGKRQELPPLKIQYKDYASWQLGLLEDKSFAVHKKYWLDKLSGNLGQLNLPEANYRPGVKTHKGRTVVTYLNKHLSQKLKNYSLKKEGTLFMGLVSTLKALLYRETNQHDVILGTPIAGRSLRELEDQIGFYVNTLTLRTQIHKEDSFESIFQKVKHTILDANTHQMYPFDRLVEELEQSRKTSRSAVFDILVVLQNTGEKMQESLVSEDKIDEIVETKRGTCIYDIKFDFHEQGDLIRFLIEYNEDIYQPEVIERFIRRFKEFSGLLLSNTEQEIGTINYVPASEIRGSEPNDHNKVGAVPNKTIIDLFHAQVDRNHTKRALQYGEESYSYEYLNQHANQIAHFLLEETHIKKEEKVGLLLDSGLPNIAAMLGVMKAGGAYVKLEPTSSEKHLSSLISDLGITTLITEKNFIELSNRLQWSSNDLVSYLCIDSEDVQSETEADNNEMMSQDLWDHVGRRAKDQITSGGWISSYTGEAIPEAEMEEYSKNVFLKLKDSLHSEMKVLEIGCSSGITLSEIAPEVALYYGTDLSPIILSDTEKMVAQRGFNNVKLRQMVAHEISTLEEKAFDLIIINSVIQNFHGHNYLLNVIRQGIGLLKDGGRIFIGDVMDINKKAEMLTELEQFKLDNRDKSYQTKTDFSSDLFVAKGYFEDLVLNEEGITSVTVSNKIGTLENELTKYRYDVILQVDKKEGSTGRALAQQNKTKRQYDQRILKIQSKENPELKVTSDQLAFTKIASNGELGLRPLEVAHNALVGSFKTDQEEFDYNRNHKWAAIIDRDDLLLDIYGALLFGSDLTFVPPTVSRQTEALADFLKEEGVTAISLNVDEAKELLAYSKEGYSDICHVIVDGGVLSSAELQAKHGSIRSFKIIDKDKITNQSLPTFNRVLTEEEKHELLFTFNDTTVDYTGEKTIISLFKEQVEKTPYQVALVFQEEELTYRELNERSNQLAHYLKDNYDIQPNQMVGIRQARSEWMVISVLGILKSGGAYVPIDPEYPQERIAFIEKDTNCKVCLNENELNAFIKSQENYSKEEVESTVTEDDLAYVIYTSGSTGTPKGVMIEHRNAWSFIMWSHDEFMNSSFDTLLFTTSLSFDLSVFEIFHALTRGKELQVIEDGLSIPEHIGSGKQLMINTVPSVVGSLLQQNMSFESVTVLNMAGEPIPTSTKLELHGKVKEIRNLYGPSEDTTYTTFFRIDQDERDLIGKPISNKQIYILNDELELQATGLAGEIHIGGDGLARGYLNQKELTQEKFIANPFKEGARLYKTGDLGRWLADGNIEFIGRKDDQVKIRGYRIELGEIEHTLEQNPEVEQAVVLAKENRTREKELIAYITSDSEQTANELRTFLGMTLPEYMLPTYYVQLDVFPLTSNGKIDKKSLPNPDGLGLSSGVEYVAPRNNLEKRLANIWEEILQREGIGILDDFFVLGGHSIKAVRLSNEYRRELSANLSMEELFEYKTIASHAELITSSTKEDFVQIEKAVTQASYAISDAQRRLWILSQTAAASVAYNMPSHITLTGFHNIESLRRAINAAVDRHEALRTVFREDESGEIRQWIQERNTLGFDIGYKDFREESNSEESAQDFINSDSFLPFDLENGPLIRVALLQLKEDEFVFYYNMHHIISDGWSLSVLTKDVLEFYEAFVSERASNLRPLNIQYKDYSAWQLAQLNGKEFNAHRAYWLERLQGELPVLDLPSTKQRPRIKTNNGHSLQAYINAEVTGGLKKYAEENGGSLYMGMLAGWNILMYHYTSQKDIIIGSSVAGRDHADLEDQIGFYSNTLALRNQINPEESFHEFFVALRNTTLKAFSHQMYPFIRLVEDLNLPGDPSRNAVFDVMLFLQNNGEKVKGQILEKEVIEAITDVGYRASKFDLNVALQEVNDCISLDITYNPDVYGRDMIEGLIRHYQQLLNAVVERPDEKVSRISYLSNQEKAALLRTVHDDSGDYPLDKTVVKLFKEQVARTGSQPALVFKDKKLSYAELDQISSQLAHYLIDNYEIKTDDLIGVMLNRSEWSIISILGILKAGGAYVPIDPEDSSLRKDAIIDDASLKVLITEIDFIHDISYYDGELFAIDVEFEPEDYSGDTPLVKSTPDDLAYVIYTSGSTGKPKGVMVPSRALVDYSFGVLEKTNMRECGSFGLVSTISADLGNTVIYPSLLTGGCLHVIAKEDIIDVEKLRNFDLDCIKMTPSHWKSLQHADNHFTPGKCLILGGEPFSEEILSHVNQMESTCDVYNHYGPTEATIGKLIKHVDRNENTSRVSLGKPIGNNQVYVLNEAHQLCPLGVSGELCISGAGLASGYLKEEDLTREKFVSNPFVEGELMYKTGDLGKILPNGEIEFVGRIDEQVKIRGYRIELDEIKLALLRSDDIEDAVVIVGESQNHEKELVAYIVTKVEQNTSDLRSMLRRSLPEYMLPALYVRLAAIPLTLNGKVDKDSLPDPQIMGIESGVEYIAPRNEVEEKIIVIISDILGKPAGEISVYDNFFDLGISSLGLMKLHASINKEMHSELQAVSVFEFSTVSALAEYLMKGSESEDATPGDENIAAEMDDIIDLM